MTTKTAPLISEHAAPTENLWVALLVIVVGGLLTGALFLIITYQYKLVLFSALVPALGAFTSISYAIWQGRVHGRVFSLALGLLLGLLIYVSYQGLQYVTFRRLMADRVREEYGTPLTPAEVEQTVDETLTEETGAVGFVGYVRYMMQQGMVIRNSMPPMGPANEVTGSAFLWYWAYDAALILISALTGAWWANNRAYCTRCARYYGRILNNAGHIGMARLGWIDKASVDEFTRSLDANHWEQAGTLLQKKRTRQSKLDIRIERCEGCDEAPTIVSVYKTPGLLSSQQPLLFRKEMDSAAYARLTAFAMLDNRKPRISSTNEWLLSSGLVLIFLSGLMYLIGVLQTSMYRG